MDEAELHEKEKQILINLPDQSIIYVKCHYPIIYQHILDYVNIELKDYSYKHKLCYFLNDLKTFPKCKICGQLCKRPIDYMRSTFKESQLFCCSKECTYKLNSLKSKETTLKRYGVTNVSLCKEIQDKKRQTCLEHYGVTNPSKSESLKQKRNNTILERFGTTNVNTLKEIRDKIKKTTIERYGVDNIMKNKDIVDKIKQSNLQKFGSEWFLGTEECLRKTKETVMEKYGVEHVNQTEEARKRSSDIQRNRKFKDRLYDIISRYESLDHVNNINMQCYRSLNKLNHYLEICKDDQLKERILIQIKRYQDKLLSEYGTLDLSEDIIKQKNLEKGLITKVKNNIQKYGVKDYNQTQECKDKIIKTCIQKFGVKYYTQSEQHRKLMHIKNMQNRYNYFCNNDFVEPQFTFEYYIDGHEDDCLKWKCKKCGQIFEDYRHPVFHDLGRCLKCYPISNNISKSEKDVLNFIKSIYSGTILENTKQFIKGYEVDIVCLDKNIAIEFDGIHWHTTEFVVDRNYHLKKTQLCNDKNFQLIHIFENEWRDNNDIVKSRLKSLFGVYNTKIYARKCEIKKVNQIDTKSFLENNHIQGNVISKYNYGLYYNDELVSIMTFGGYRINLGQTAKENEYELLRFCNKLNYHIPGAAGKLLKYFIKNHNPKRIISYADRRWSKGNLYEKLGFSFVRNTEPNYYYNIKDNLENRFDWRKSVLKDKLKKFNPDLTEKQNMKNNGFYQIFDCGSMLYEMTF